LLQVLHWLRKAIQEGTNIDKFLDLWIAFELLISGESSEKVFLKGDIEKFRQLILNSDFCDLQKKIIIKKIERFINNNSLMEKFYRLIKRLEISFSDDEINTLDTLRNKRNDLVHGKKDIEVVDDELDKMRTIIERVFIEKIGLLK
jgi:hypothetical protein